MSDALREAVRANSRLRKRHREAVESAASGIERLASMLAEAREENDRLRADLATSMETLAKAQALQAEMLKERAALAQPAAPGWQPIETAPTDGTEFLAHKPSIGLFAARILDGDHPDCEYDGGVHCAWDHGYVEDVTHWMPLPAAPRAPQPGGQGVR